MSDFVVATFNVIGTGRTTVNLNVEDLGLGVVVSGDMKTADLVEGGVVKDVTSQSGFSGYTYSTKTLVTEGSDTVRGDVDKNGKFQVGDITALQRYFAEYRRLNTIDATAADANKDGVLTVKDVTMLQRWLAEA